MRDTEEADAPILGSVQRCRPWLAWELQGSRGSLVLVGLRPLASAPRAECTVLRGLRRHMGGGHQPGAV